MTDTTDGLRSQPRDLMSGDAITTVFVCRTCRRAGEPLADGAVRQGALLTDALARSAATAQPANVQIVGVDCLSNCNAGCTVAIAAAGKWTYVVGRLDPGQDVADVLTFAIQHSQRADGVPPWRDRPQIARKNVVARIPPLNFVQPEAAE